MTIQKYFLVCCLLTILPWQAFAQKKPQAQRDSIIKGQTIRITQIYEPKVKEPAKPILVPFLPPPDTSKPAFEYVVPQQTLSYTYHSIPIRPLALGKQEKTLPFPNYIKAGIGNLNTIYLDGGIGGIRGKNYQTDFHVSHLNQKGKIQNQQSSYTTFAGSGKYITPTHAFDASLNIRNRRFRYYGYDPELYNYGSSALQQSFTDGKLKLKVENITKNDLNIDYQPEIAVGAFQDNFSAKEKDFMFNLPAEWHFGSTAEQADTSYAPYGKISLGIYGHLVQFDNTKISTANNLFKINPAFDVQIEHLAIHAGLSPAFGRGGKVWLLPDIGVRAGFFNNQLKISAGVKSDVYQNTYLDLTLINPYIDDIFPITQSKSDQVFAGVQTSAGPYLTIGGTLSWRHWQNLPLFVNGYDLNSDGKRFQVVFSPNVQAINLEAFVRFQPNDILGISAKGSWNNFYKTVGFDRAFGHPGLKIEGLLSLHPVKKLYAHAGFTFLNNIFAQNATKNSIELQSIFDLSAEAEYNIISRLSIFLQANNLLNKTYQRWNQYPVYGINLIGGIRFKF